MDHCHIEFDESELLDKADKLTPWDGGDTPTEVAAESDSHPKPSGIPELDWKKYLGKQFHTHDAPDGIGIIKGAPGWGFQEPLNKQWYGAVVVDDMGRILLKKNLAEKWELPINMQVPGGGTPDNKGDMLATSFVAAVNQTGHTPGMLGVVPGTYDQYDGKANYFLFFSKEHHPESVSPSTKEVAWFTFDEAKKLIQESQGGGLLAVPGQVKAIGIAEWHLEGLKKKTNYELEMDFFNSLDDIKPIEVATPEPDPVPWGEGGFAPVDEPEPEPEPVPEPEPQFIEPVGHQLPLPFPPDLRQLDKKKVNFPALEDLDGLIEVQDLGGSTGAKLVEDPVTGERYVLKRGADPGHIIEEMYADAAYQAAGALVPEFQAYNTEHGPVKLARFIPNARSLEDVYRSGTGEEIRDVERKLQEHFAADVLMGNWDAVGLVADNVLVDKDGEVWRIDNGGSFRRRAMGDMKGAAWNHFPEELWTLRDIEKNKSMGRTFGDMTWVEVFNSMKKVEDQREKILAELPDFLQDDVEARLDVFKDVLEISKVMIKDKWDQEYIDDFARKMVGLQKAGIEERFPSELVQRDGYGNVVVDEFEQAWDSLRGLDSIMQDLWNYIDENEGNPTLISEWMDGQGAGSWSNQSQALKYWIYKNRSVASEDMYWGHASGYDFRNIQRRAKVYFSDNPDYDETFTAWHAFNYLLARSVDTEVTGDGTLTIGRTEPRSVMEDNFLSAGDSGVTMERGLAESGSIFNAVVVNGDQLTVQEVPYHRIMGMYFYERRPGSRMSPFYGDKENEIIFIPEGLEFDYVGTVDDGEDLDNWRETKQDL